MQKAVPQKVINYRKPSVGRTVMQNRTLILMCLPAILFFLVFSYLPMPGAYIAFTNFQYDKGIFASPFVGLRNFQFLFISGQLGLLLKNTVLYNLAFIVVGNFLQLTFAILLNEVACKGYKKAAQSIMFLPYFISDVPPSDRGRDRNPESSGSAGPAGIRRLCSGSLYRAGKGHVNRDYAGSGAEIPESAGDPGLF